MSKLIIKIPVKELLEDKEFNSKDNIIDYLASHTETAFTIPALLVGALKITYKEAESRSKLYMRSYAQLQSLIKKGFVKSKRKGHATFYWYIKGED